MINLVRRSLMSAKVLILADGDQNSLIYKNIEVLKNISEQKETKDGTAFVCRNFACSAPINSLEELKKALELD